MSDQNPRPSRNSPESPAGLPRREQKHHDESVVTDLASDLSDPNAGPVEPAQPEERRKTIRQRRSKSRSHWNLDQSQESQSPAKENGVASILGIVALVITTIGGIVIMIGGGLSGLSGSGGPPRTLHMALISLEQGDSEGARELITRTPPPDRDSAYFFSIASRTAIAQRDLATATRFLGEGLEKYPDHPLTQIAKAEVELARGEPAAAAASAQKAIDLDSSLNIAWRVLGQARAAQDDSAGALEALKKSLEIAPQSVSTVTATVQLYTALEQPEEADRLFRVSLEENPNSDLAITYAGYVNQKGDSEAAGAILDEAIQKDPKNLRLLSLRARLHMQQKNFPAAQEILKQAAANDSKNASTWIALGNAYGADDRFLDAEASFKKAIEIDPTNAATFNNLGYALLAQKNYADAETALLEALAINPQQPQALQNLARLYTDTFQEDKLAGIREKLEALKAKSASPPQ